MEESSPCFRVPTSHGSRDSDSSQSLAAGTVRSNQLSRCLDSAHSFVSSEIALGFAYGIVRPFSLLCWLVNCCGFGAVQLQEVGDQIHGYTQKSLRVIPGGSFPVHLDSRSRDFVFHFRKVLTHR